MGITKRLASFALLVTLVGSATSGCAGTSIVEWVGYPEGVDGLVSAADLVVLASVDRVDRGRTAGRGSGSVGYRDVHLAVERVLFARDAAPADVVAEELGWFGEDATEPHDLTWSESGDRGVWFLARGDSGRYSLLGPRGRVLIVDDELEPAGEQEDPARAEVAAMTPDELIARIEAAAPGARATPRVTALP